MPVPSTIKSVAVAALSLPVAGWRAVPAQGQVAVGDTGQTPPGRQNDCLACHNQSSWSADRVNGGET